MDKQFAATSASPSILLFVNGDLRLKGQDELAVMAKADNPEDLSLDAREDQVVIRSSGNCGVRVPREATIHIEAVYGNATIKGLDGDTKVDIVNGDLDLRSVGGIKIDTVNGNITAKNVDGDLIIDTANGDVSARGVEGDFIVAGKINGNLNLRDGGGSAKASADGNITLQLDPTPGHQFEFSCQGNVFCRLSEEASAEISVPRASQVMVDLPGIHASAPVQAPYALTLGEGDAKVTLSADGNVILDTHAPEWGMGDFDIDVGSEVEGMADAGGQQINQQVESQMRMVEEQLNAQLASLTMRLSAAKLTEDQARRIEERAREASQRAMERAQERVRRTQERMEQKLAAAQRKMEYRAQAHERAARPVRHPMRLGGVSFAGSPKPPTPPTPVGEPVSAEERLMILRMLEQKKLTMEEAEVLLSALEGKEQ